TRTVTDPAVGGGSGDALCRSQGGEKTPFEQPTVVTGLRGRRRGGLPALDDEPGTRQHLVEGEYLGTRLAPAEQLEARHLLDVGRPGWRHRAEVPDDGHLARSARRDLALEIAPRRALPVHVLQVLNRLVRRLLHLRDSAAQLLGHLVHIGLAVLLR